MPESSTPYISFVVTARNDNHGDNMIARMRAFVRNLDYHSNRLRFDTELIVVEWNPPAGKPDLRSELNCDDISAYLTIRFIKVPAFIHSSMQFSDRFGLHQMIAKNAGIRRASGEFIACTNIDILFSSPLFDHLSKRRLHPDKFYRANRCDVPEEILGISDPAEQEKFAFSHILQRWGMDARFHGLKPYTQRLFLYRYSFFRFTFPLLRFIKKLVLEKYTWKIALIDKEASGDFTLMSRTTWARICGYPELQVYPLHFDSLALVAASALGFRQHVFDPAECVFHIHHRESWMPGNEKRPGELSWNEIRAIAKNMLINKTTYPFSKEDWGLSNELFQEY